MLCINKLKIDSKEFKYFLGGFIEGDGSLSVAIKSNKNLKFKFSLDPEFSIYQHKSGIALLEASKMFFRAGNIYKKDEDSDVYVFRISNRKTILEKVIPYFKKYVIPFSCKYVFFDDYCSILQDLVEKKHLEKKDFLDLVKKAYDLNPNFKGKERKYTLEEIQKIILRDYTPDNENTKIE